MEVDPSKWDVGLSRTGKYTSYIMKYGINRISIRLFRYADFYIITF